MCTDGILSPTKKSRTLDNVQPNMCKKDLNVSKTDNGKIFKNSFAKDVNRMMPDIEISSLCLRSNVCISHKKLLLISPN